MAAILLFHLAQGLTAGVRAFADDLRAAGHDVNTPDLYDGNTFDDAELFVYPGDRHLFADSSLPDYDEAAATLLEKRALSFLDRVG